MKKIFRNLFLAAVAMTAFASCEEKPRNTEELIDPWLRERTPVNVRLESQIGPALITSDWKTDEVGSVSVSLVTAALDMSAVKVVALDFAYPDSEFCPTSSINPGDTIDLSDGTEDFVVTSKSGETRTYTISYTVFTDPLEGCYSFTPVGSILDPSHEYDCACVMIGGFEKWITLCQVMDKHWLWDYNRIYWPQNEDDNTLSFRLERADDVTGETFGTVVNTPGPDEKFADYQFKVSTNDPKPTYNINEEYRLIPGGLNAVPKTDTTDYIPPKAGKGRWAKHGDGFITIYAYEDENYTTPLHKLELLESGDHVFWADALDSSGGSAAKTVTVPSLALHRSFGEGPFTNKTDDWSDARWYVNNIRNVFWLIQKDSDSALENHIDLLAE